MLQSKVWAVERPKMGSFYIFEPLKVHTYEPNINLIRLMLVMQNPEFLFLATVASILFHHRKYFYVILKEQMKDMLLVILFFVKFSNLSMQW